MNNIEGVEIYVEMLLVIIVIVSTTIAGTLAGLMFVAGVDTSLVMAMFLYGWAVSSGYIGVIFIIREMALLRNENEDETECEKVQ